MLLHCPPHLLLHPTRLLSPPRQSLLPLLLLNQQPLLICLNRSVSLIPRHVDARKHAPSRLEAEARVDEHGAQRSLNYVREGLQSRATDPVVKRRLRLRLRLVVTRVPPLFDVAVDSLPRVFELGRRSLDRTHEGRLEVRLQVLVKLRGLTERAEGFVRDEHALEGREFALIKLSEAFE